MNYTVVRGDSLSVIGRKFNVPWQDIANLNNLKSPYTIHAGQVLKIPGQAPAPAPAPTLDYSSIINFYTKQGWRVTSDYGIRVHPVTGQAGTFHRGIDFGGKPVGEPIRTPVAGTVTTSQLFNSWGNLVGITDKDGFIHLFAHLNVRDVRVGQRVNKGDIIGKNGSTGQSTGPHLHYQVNTPNGGTLGVNAHCDPKMFKY